MRRVELTRGMVAVVDDTDYQEVSNHIWHVRPSSNGDVRRWYAFTWNGYSAAGKRSWIQMANFIIRPEPGFRVDHRDHDGLNNQRFNLRVCTNDQNVRNTRGRRIKNGRFKGAYKEGSRWKAVIRHNKTLYYLGTFTTEIEAAEAYDRKAIELNGEFACTNRLTNV